MFPRLFLKGSTDPRQTPLDFLHVVHQTPVRIPPSVTSTNSRRKFHEKVWEVFSTYGTVPWIPFTGPLARFTTKFTIPHKLLHDPDTWTDSHLLHLKSDYDVLLKIIDALYRKCTRCKTLWLRILPLSVSYYRPSIVFTRLTCEIRSHLNREILVQFCHRLNVFFLDRS